MLTEALGSDDPDTVEQCLDHAIEKQQYTAVLQLRNHARKMKQVERARQNGKRDITFADINKSLEPWRALEKKADVFLRKRLARDRGER